MKTEIEYITKYVVIDIHKVYFFVILRLKVLLYWNQHKIGGSKMDRIVQRNRLDK
jgi:hypothetical protein